MIGSQVDWLAPDVEAHLQRAIQRFTNMPEISGIRARLHIEDPRRWEEAREMSQDLLGTSHPLTRAIVRWLQEDFPGDKFRRAQELSSTQRGGIANQSSSGRGYQEQLLSRGHTLPSLLGPATDVQPLSVVTLATSPAITSFDQIVEADPTASRQPPPPTDVSRPRSFPDQYEGTSASLVDVGFDFLLPVEREMPLSSVLVPSGAKLIDVVSVEAPPSFAPAIHSETLKFDAQSLIDKPHPLEVVRAHEAAPRSDDQYLARPIQKTVEIPADLTEGDVSPLRSMEQDIKEFPSPLVKHEDPNNPAGAELPVSFLSNEPIDDDMPFEITPATQARLVALRSLAVEDGGEHQSLAVVEEFLAPNAASDFRAIDFPNPITAANEEMQSQEELLLKMDLPVLPPLTVTKADTTLISDTEDVLAGEGSLSDTVRIVPRLSAPLLESPVFNPFAKEISMAGEQSVPQSEDNAIVYAPRLPSLPVPESDTFVMFTGETTPASVGGPVSEEESLSIVSILPEGGHEAETSAADLPLEANTGYESKQEATVAIPRAIDRLRSLSKQLESLR